MVANDIASILNDTEQMHGLDASNMLDRIVHFPEQWIKAYRIAEKVQISLKSSEINMIVIAGMGGSAIGGDVLRAYIRSEIHLPIIVSRNYHLPAFVDEKTLVIVSSYSGDTEETLNAFDEAVQLNASIICITSGGNLGELAKEYNISTVNIPGGFQPRAALGYSIVSLIVLMSKLGWIDNKSHEIFAVEKLLRRKADEYAPQVELNHNGAKQLASKIYNKLPIIYTSDNNDVVGARWRGQFAENAEMLSYGNVFPEMNHNEIVGWHQLEWLLKKTVVLILRDGNDDPRILKRMKVTKDILTPLAGEVIEIESEGNFRLERLFSLIYLGDIVSFYLAILNGVDPTPVENINKLKAALMSE